MHTAVSLTMKLSIIPIVPGLPQRLGSGIRVLDVGCGSGRALNALAAAFPRSQFTGYDLCDDAVAAGNSLAADQGLDNLRLEVKDLTVRDSRGINMVKNVSLHVLYNSYASEMMISNKEDFSGAQWEAAQEEISEWTLDGADGEKAVFAKFRDESGHISVVAGDKILLDRLPPQKGKVIINREWFNTSGNIIFSNGQVRNTNHEEIFICNFYSQVPRPNSSLLIINIYFEYVLTCIQNMFNSKTSIIVNIN